MARQRPLEEAWNSYREVAVPSDALPVQLDETRKAFYAGALSAFNELMNNLTYDPDAPEDPDANEQRIAFVESIQAELEEFGEEMRKRVRDRRGG